MTTYNSWYLHWQYNCYKIYPGTASSACTSSTSPGCPLAHWIHNTQILSGTNPSEKVFSCWSLHVHGLNPFACSTTILQLQPFSWSWDVWWVFRVIVSRNPWQSVLIEDTILLWNTIPLGILRSLRRSHDGLGNTQSCVKRRSSLKSHRLRWNVLPSRT